MRVATAPFALLLLAGCTPERPYRPDPAAPVTQPGEVRRPTDSELRRMRETAEVVVFGEVERREEEPTGLTYRVRVVELLHASGTIRDDAKHPHLVDAELAVGDFLYRPKGGTGTIGALRELSRYIFFLSPAQGEGRWLNLEDPAGLPLPDARPTLDALRALKDTPPKAGEPGP
jgi:hypothetical protein